MKLDVARLPYQKQIEVTENVKFDAAKFVCHIPLVEVLSCTAKIKVQRFEEFIYVDLSIVSDVVLQCSYTLKQFRTTLKGNDELHFSSNLLDEEDDDIIVYKGTVIDLDEYIFNLLSACVPLSPKAPGAKIPEDGKGYRIISDEALSKEEKSSPFDVLEDLDL